MKKIIALVPMKGNSERVKNKNLREFGGLPLFCQIIETLLQIEYVKKVVVNTDSEEIASNITKRYSDVVIHWRSKHVCGDLVSMNDVIDDDLKRVDHNHFLQTHSTNPLLTVATINKAIEKYFEDLGTYDSLFGVTQLQTRLYSEDGTPLNHNPKELLRTQDLPPIFEENSNLYIFSKDSFAESRNKRVGLNPQLFAIPKLEAVDIDELEDFILAEILYKMRK